MARDDSILYSGDTSASGNPRVNNRRVETASKNVADKAVLTPVAELVMEEIRLAKTKANDITTLQDNVDAEDIKAQLLGRKYFIAYLNELQTKLIGVLRSKPSSVARSKVLKANKENK